MVGQKGGEAKGNEKSEGRLMEVVAVKMANEEAKPGTDLACKSAVVDAGGMNQSMGVWRGKGGPGEEA